MLPDLLEVGERVLLSAHDGRHSSERGSLELLASVERVSKLEQSAVVLGDLVRQVAGRVELSERELVVVLVVQHVEERGEERVQVVEDREIGEDGSELLVDRVLGELDLSHVEAERGSTQTSSRQQV